MEILKNSHNYKVFLGGTCNQTTWRQDIMSILDDCNIDYFNPVVDDWTEECYQEELRQREICSHCLYVITPKMTGVYSIAEVVDDSNKQPDKTLFYFLTDDEDRTFDEGQIKSLDKVGVMVENNGGRYFRDEASLVQFFRQLPSFDTNS